MRTGSPDGCEVAFRREVITYIPACDDEAEFEGWYTNRESADAVFADFVEKYPRTIVHLVTREKSEWRNWDYAGAEADLALILHRIRADALTSAPGSFGHSSARYSADAPPLGCRACNRS
jgi:hypothetical protein